MIPDKALFSGECLSDKQGDREKKTGRGGDRETRREDSGVEVGRKSIRWCRYLRVAGCTGAGSFWTQFGPGKHTAPQQFTL